MTVRAVASPPVASRRRGARRWADVVLSLLLLVVAAPLMLVVALAVRWSSHGAVLHREQHTAADGRRVELLSFRTVVDGGRTHAHAHVRRVVGGGSPHTPVGRVLERLRLHRLPRIVDVLRGRTSFFRRG